MRLFKRILVFICAMLAVIVAVQWFRSYSLVENWAWCPHDNMEYQVFSARGGLYLSSIRNWGQAHGLIYRPESGPHGWDSWGDESVFLLSKGSAWYPTFITGSLRNDGLQPICLVILPYWMICLILATPLWVSFRRAAMRRRRALQGLCVKCGYDLRSSTSMCPECGELPITTRKSSSPASLEPDGHVIARRRT